jgi:hypothetical protein
VVNIPVFICRLSFLRTYVFVALSSKRFEMLTSQRRTKTKMVHKTSGTAKIFMKAAFARNSSQITTALATMIKMLRATTLGVIQGLPIQTIDCASVEDV